MSIKTYLPGRVRNTTLHKSNALMPVFEAVVNSIQSIEDSGQAPQEGGVTVTVLRSQARNSEQLTLNHLAETRGEVCGFQIEDNGVGFNQEKFAAFETLDTNYRESDGGRGIGRLFWLKVFDSVEVESVFEESSNKKKRSFRFSVDQGVYSENTVTVKEETERKTTVHVAGIRDYYLHTLLMQCERLVDLLLEHILWFFVRNNGCPRITIVDDNEKHCLNTRFSEFVKPTITESSFSLKESKFSVIHTRLYDSTLSSHFVALCANGRVVQTERFQRGKSLGLFGPISDKSGKFVHGAYVTSEFLDANVRPERMDFSIPKDKHPLLESEEISVDDIIDQVIAQVRLQLSEYIERVRVSSEERIEKYSASIAPRYRPVIKYLSEDDKTFDPSMPDSELEIHLHKCLMKVEQDLLREGQDVMGFRDDETQEEYNRRIGSYMNRLQDLKKSDLANYVAHRKVVIELLEKALQKQEDDKYSKEKVIHELIVPKQTDSSGLEEINSNLWLLNERLAFHDYLASDKPLNQQKITHSDSRDRPDIDVLQVFDRPILVSEEKHAPFGCLTIIELKRPMAFGSGDTARIDPIKQVLGYLKKIREGKVNTSSGRPISNARDIPGFCYVVADLTQSVVDSCLEADLTKTEDQIGYFGFHRHHNAYIEVISFDRLVKGAKDRNRAFFDKLGLPASSVQNGEN